MKFNTPTQTVLYSIEQAIKEYRKYSQQNIGKAVDDITVDQCLILIILDKQPKISQAEIAELVFKDFASITRIIELMVKKEYLIRTINETDRRKFTLKLTPKGKKAIKTLTPVITLNRETTLRGISDKEMTQLYTTLQKIISNCKSDN